MTSTRSSQVGDVATYSYCGRVFSPKNRTFRTDMEGLDKLAASGRLEATTNSLSFVSFLDDFRVFQLTNIWDDIGGIQSRSDPKIYVVQTATKVVERCILMTTDPGDLVLDPTCGSGTSAYVAEQWGRRWITIDTSRVALALARARIMGARYSYYLLADSREGQIKEAEASGNAPSSQPVNGNIRHGFVYERVPHITLKSIANNAEIDVIWEKWQAELEPLREKLNKTLRRSGRNGRPRVRPTPRGRARPKNCTPIGGKPGSPGRRKSTPPSPPRPSSNTCTTSPIPTRKRSVSPAASRWRAFRPIASWALARTTS